MPEKVHEKNFQPFSEKQLKVFRWWVDLPDYDGIIADGSIRAGKTMPMGLSYVLWAMDCFNNQSFAFCSKTIHSFYRNVWHELRESLLAYGYKVKERRAENKIEIINGATKNLFYVFGGKDESSQDLIQGLTLAGVLFDEVALMPESFVTQATARCSVEGSKFWFNCNPESPYHWFMTDWIEKAYEKRLLRLSFTMDDNPSLSERTKDRYKSLYSGFWYKRYILGFWCVAEGVIYDMFDDAKNVIDKLDIDPKHYMVSIDYGTNNPCVFLMHAINGNEDRIVKEYYYDSSKKMRQKTDSEYLKDFTEFVNGFDVQYIYTDPSASSFKAELRNAGFTQVRSADNTVRDGISGVSKKLGNGSLKIMRSCIETIKEISTYSWNPKAQERGEDIPLKMQDHAMDALRYGVYTHFKRYI